MAAGLALSSLGTVWALYIGHGLLIGFLGNGAIYAPLMIYVSRWFDRRRGTALALISSGQYIAGMIWPSLLEVGHEAFRLAIGHAGLWRGGAGNPAAAGAATAGPRTVGAWAGSSGSAAGRAGARSAIPMPRWC